MQNATERPPSLKPKQPDAYDGRREFLAVNTWSYKIEQYLSILLVLTPSLMKMTEADHVLFASTFLTGNNAVWWYTIVQMNKVPTTWDQFKKLIQDEFVPRDHIMRVREKLRRLRQVTSASKYLSDFRNITLTIP